MINYCYAFVIATLLLVGCESRMDGTPKDSKELQDNQWPDESISDSYVQILGVAQDAGYPQINCDQEHCQNYWNGLEPKRRVSSLGIINRVDSTFWILDATPDFPSQFQELKTTVDKGYLAGIFLTHAHIGHYTGLMYLGHEAMGADEVPVYMMPKMLEFIRNNGPWSQLVSFRNIHPVSLTNNKAVSLGRGIDVEPILVPHRDEYSETVGYRVTGPSKSLLYIPDINKWELWNRSIIDEISKVDYALLDATFYDADELPGRNMEDIPHPFVQESMELFKHLNEEERAKIMFIHFNHTNPLLFNTPERNLVLQKGYKIAEEGMRLSL